MWKVIILIVVVFIVGISIVLVACLTKRKILDSAIMVGLVLTGVGLAYVPIIEPIILKIRTIIIPW